MNKLEYKVSAYQKVLDYVKGGDIDFVVSEEPHVFHLCSQLEKWISTAEKQIHRGKSEG